MIKKTYNNLPQEKKDRILKAVQNEFNRVPTEKVSINRIVKSANISRGSFYQYFDDKVDLIDLVTRDMFNFICNVAGKSLKQSDGNIFMLYIDLFDSITALIMENEDKRFLANLFDSFKVNNELVTEYLKFRFPHSEQSRIFDSFYKLINLDFISCDSRDDVENLFCILNLLMRDNIFNIFVKEVELSVVRKNYLRRIELLQKGFATEKAINDYVKNGYATGGLQNDN